MIKNILLLLVLINLTFPEVTWAEESMLIPWEKPFVIPRASWWANSQYNSKYNIYWEQILESWSNYVPAERSQASIDYANKKNKEIEDYLYWNFLYQFTSQETIKTKDDGAYTFGWPIKYTNYVDSIVVHHTHSEYENSLEWMKDIHRYHSLNRQWWDIGYNYVIWYDGEIYEGREGWDYVVAAHSKYNNFGTVWIAVMGNYDSEWINDNQHQSLESLIQYLIVRYWIDLNEKRYYHMNCSWSKCDTFYLETYLDNTLIWHRDATHTTCPWEKLYEQIQDIRNNNLEFSTWRVPVLRNWNLTLSVKESNTTNTSKIQKILISLRRYSPEQKQNIIDLIDIKKSQTSNTTTLETLQTIRLAVILSLK